MCAGPVLQAPAAVYVVDVDAGVQEHEVTKMAMGAGLVYSWYPDSMFADGEMAHIIQDIGLGGLRWPGGAVVTYYHWDDLNGQGWQDNWNPSYNPVSDLPPEKFQDLDEYLALIDETGAEIMLGVNMSSGIEWDREAEAIAEASNLMVYVQSQGYDVKYIYFDNENFQDGNNYNRDDDNDGEAWTPTTYAQQFNLYATAVKATFPDAKLIANARNSVSGAAFLSDMQTMLSIAGANIDFVDVHYYWSWATATWDIWKSQTPMLRGGGQTYKESIEYANNLFAAEGYPHVRTVILEWNIAPGPWETDPAHTKFKTALMQSEMQLQFLQAGLDIGMLWALDVPSVDPTSDKHAIHNNDPNATTLWMWLFSKAVGNTVVQSSSPASGVYIFAAKGDQGELLVWLLNKTDNNHTVELNISGYTVNNVSEAWRFHDEGDGRGALMTIGLWEVAGKKRTTLRADSLNMIGFNYPSNTLPEQVEIEARLVEPVPDGILVAWDGLSGLPDRAANGISGALSTGGLYEIDDSAGSTDGTYGSTFSGAPTASSAFAVRATNGSDTVAFSISNETGAPLRLDAVHFDYSSWWTSSPKDVTLLYSSGDLATVTNHTPVNSVSGLSNTGKGGNYPDFDWSLAGLADRVLEHGEEANFILQVSNAAEDWANGAFDNIAISGGTVSNATDTVLLSWRAQTGKKYTVMQSGNLLSNDWNSASSTLMGQPGDMSEPADLELPGFYRLDIQ